MLEMRSLVAHRYGGVEYQPNDIFECESKHVAGLRALHRAEPYVRVAPAVVMTHLPKTPVKRTRRKQKAK